jgi:single-strand DNA-binding protein
MAGLNKVTLIGNLGRDPELRYTQGGTAVLNFTLATTERWNDREGGKQERTEWHRVVVWGKQAEVCSNLLAKGKQVYVEGRIQSREWKDKEGGERRSYEIVANRVMMLGRREGEAAGAGADDSAAQPSESADPEYSDDDIPF